jgi:putative DNA primase/helicase
MPNLSDALALAARGYAIIPTNGKRPLTRHGVKDASSDSAQIKRWWTKWPDAGIGIATGAASKVVVLDIDAGKGGLESLAELERRHGELPSTIKVKTGGGGVHPYFQYPEGAIGNRAGIMPGVDFRGDGGYVIAPPSIHVSGNAYEFCEGCSPGEVELAAMPDWLLTLVRPEDKTETSVAPKPGDFDGALAAMRKITTTDNSDGSKRLFTYCCRCREHALTAEQTIAAIRVIATERPFPNHWSNDEISDRWMQAAKTVEIGSAIDAAPTLWQKEGRTDAANAKYFARNYGKNFLWCDPWKSWVYYDSKRWTQDQTCAIQSAAKQCAQSRWLEAAKIVANPDADGQLKKDVLSFAKYCNSAAGIQNMLSLAKSELPVVPDTFDTDHYLLNVNNGTINLRTGELRAHDRGDLITQIAPFDHDSSAACPRFLKFLDSVFSGNKNLIGFMHRLLGYCLTGDVSEQILPIFWGEGSNGKSTLTTLMLWLLGDYACKAPEKLLVAKKFSAHPTEIAKLFRKRFVVANETDEGAELSEARVKELTGGDRLTTRRMKEDFWDFDPTHKIPLCTNYKPAVKGAYAIWRRIRLIAFLVKFWSESKGETGPQELKADPKLPEELKAEASGILAWLVAGCLEWQRNGLGVPPEVNQATEQYRQSEDLLADYIAKCCTVQPDATANVSTVLDAYREYTGDSGMSDRQFTRLMTAKGFTKRRATAGNDKGTWQWHGLRAAECQVSASVSDVVLSA